jgi:hypothetical protein
MEGDDIRVPPGDLFEDRDLVANLVPAMRVKCETGVDGLTMYSLPSISFLLMTLQA